MKITPNRSEIYARKDFYRKNEITCIMWDKLRAKSVETAVTTNDEEF